MNKALQMIQDLAVEEQRQKTRKAKAEADALEQALADMADATNLQELAATEARLKVEKAEIERDQARMLRDYTAQAIKEDRNPMAN